MYEDIGEDSISPLLVDCIEDAIVDSPSALLTDCASVKALSLESLTVGSDMMTGLVAAKTTSIGS